MDFEQMKTALIERLLNKQLVSATISQPRMKSNEIKRIKLKPIELKGVYHIQLEFQYERILKHENIPVASIENTVHELFEDFRQFQGQFEEEMIQIQLSKKNKVLYKSSVNEQVKKANLSHNRKKNYLLDPETPYPFLIRLGVQTADGKVKNKNTISSNKLIVSSNIFTTLSTTYRKIVRFVF